MATLAQEERRQRNRKRMRRFRSIPEHQEEATRKRKQKYAEDAGFRRRQGERCKAWREKNHDYDMLRKTIAAINECGDEEKRARKNELQHKRIARMSTEEAEAFRKRQSKAGMEWHHSQMDDPELGWLYRLVKKQTSRFYTVEMKEAARVQYRAIMDRRREERRCKRIGGLMEGCTEKQKARIRGGQDMRRGRRA